MSAFGGGQVPLRSRYRLFRLQRRVLCQSTICALPKNSPPDCFYLASLGTVASNPLSSKYSVSQKSFTHRKKHPLFSECFWRRTRDLKSRSNTIKALYFVSLSACLCRFLRFIVSFCFTSFWFIKEHIKNTNTHQAQVAPKKIMEMDTSETSPSNLNSLDK